MPAHSASTKRDAASFEAAAAVSHARSLNKPLRLIAILFISIFVSETAVMFFLPSLPPLPNYAKALIDAALLSLLMAPVLFVFLYRPLRQFIERHDRATQSLIESDKRFHDIAKSANEWIWEVDAEGKYTYASPIVKAILGYTPEEILGKHFYDLFHAEDRDALKDQAFKVFASKEAFHGFINRNIHKDGRSVWLATSGVPLLDENGELLGYRGVDIGKHDESAITDSLTGLLDREGFFLFAEQQLRLALRNNVQAVVLFADMDNLKAINDEFGHLEGDRALIDIAQVLKKSVRESDTVARFGGDEFVVFLTGSTAADVKRVVAKNIERELDGLNASESRRYQLSMSVGFALHDPEHPTSLNELVLRADGSMYETKKRARS